jgi:hypothetical protein
LQLSNEVLTLHSHLKIWDFLKNRDRRETHHTRAETDERRAVVD